MKKMIFSVAVVLVASFGFYIYSELEGLPWKHAEVKREAIEYMKQKYNMDAVAAGSFYNFKFKVYTAKVFNVMDPDKVIIHVEDERDFDEQGLYVGRRLQDDYSLVYWSEQIRHELKQRYPDLFQLEDIDTIQVEYAYYALSLTEGISSEKDQYGVRIPVKPKDIPELSIRLKTVDIGDPFLTQLRVVINDMVKTSNPIDVIVRAASTEKTQQNEMTKTAILHIEHDKLKQLHSIDELKREIKIW
ncbi:hypothetical protein M5X00_22355 [Paenibacillus alvei]|uniref:YfjL-like N-terminal domain-containing protein n=1 Tax=Paenibacillus alvei TaxID=44250 RepID=A0ABT4GTY3_PAEAL|nr:MULTISPECIES: hypothetical protein [Paenibacillus]EJW16379.1 hypothetical protein PAV_6c04610 [Paenibacillus alvei DSM 29]MCY7483129.1 hypothetical protein [Paenibacillus alvei]MCY9543079.1 hypothetical protein [Paenibacillus alvei]MCY9707854.1 hypothetical protein [Paenibacillus alvei]MCY9736293.1 hypothetical protein [Paenibacillus alvei]